MVLQASRYCQLELGDYIRLARHSGAIRRSDAMYALDAKAAIFRRARRLLPALAAILIPASVLSKKSAMLSRSASERISLCFFALVSTLSAATVMDTFAATTARLGCSSTGLDIRYIKT